MTILNNEGDISKVNKDKTSKSDFSEADSEYAISLIAKTCQFGLCIQLYGSAY